VLVKALGGPRRAQKSFKKKWKRKEEKVFPGRASEGVPEAPPKRNGKERRKKRKRERKEKQGLRRGPDAGWNKSFFVSQHNSVWLTMILIGSG
jgi:hypothetical protein